MVLPTCAGQGGGKVSEHVPPYRPSFKLHAEKGNYETAIIKKASIQNPDMQDPAGYGKNKDGTG